MRHLIALCAVLTLQLLDNTTVTVKASGSTKTTPVGMFLNAGRSGENAYPPPERVEYLGAGGPGSTENLRSNSSCFVRLVAGRVSVRAFTNAAVTDEVLYDALRIARLAPSAGNLQAYQVVIVRDRDQKVAIANAAARQHWVAEAPIILVFLADPDRSVRKYDDRGRSLYAVQDATIAAAYTQLALEVVGLSSCWVGAFHEDLVADIVGVPYYASPPDDVQPQVGGDDEVGALNGTFETRPGGTLRPVVLMPVGVAVERPNRPRRRPIRNFLHHGTVGSMAPGSSDRSARVVKQRKRRKGGT